MDCWNNGVPEYWGNFKDVMEAFKIMKFGKILNEVLLTNKEVGQRFSILHYSPAPIRYILIKFSK